MTTYIQTNSWSNVYYEPETVEEGEAGVKCRWLDESYGDPIVIAKDKTGPQDFFEWMAYGYNWVIVCGGLIGLVIFCILCCCCLQAYKKKRAIEDTNKPWHGGNSAFY